MRIAVWNTERGGRHAGVAEQQRALLSSIEFDLAILSEPPADVVLDGRDTVASPALRDGRSGMQSGVAILAGDLEPVEPPLPYERLAVAARGVIDSVPVVAYGSTLPWRSAPRHVPDLALPGESASAMFARYLARQVADIERLRTDHPGAVVIWAGDFNQSLEGPNLVGSAQGRALLEEALECLGFVAWNRTAPHARKGLCAIDLVCGPRGGRASGAKATQLLACARSCGARIVAVSSVDAYEACLGAGMGDGRFRSLLSPYRLPIAEDAPLRRVPFPLPEGFLPPDFEHDNAAMEHALMASGVDAVVLRPAMIYGTGAPPQHLRESFLVSKILRGERRLELPWEGTQYFSRVAVERVARAVLAGAERAPSGYFACNVVDPYGWTFAGLAGEVGRILEFEWEPTVTGRVNPFVGDPTRHRPFNVPSPCFFSDERLRHELGVGVDQPDPLAALEETVRWLSDELRAEPTGG